MGACAVLPDGVPLSSPPAAPPTLPAALTAPSCTHGTAALACSVVAGHGDRGHGHIGAPRGGTAGAAWPRRRLRSGRETPASPHPQPPIPPSPHPVSPHPHPRPQRCHCRGRAEGEGPGIGAVLSQKTPHLCPGPSPGSKLFSDPPGGHIGGVMSPPPDSLRVWPQGGFPGFVSDAHSLV